MLESLHQRDVLMQDPYFAVKIQQFLYIRSRKHQFFCIFIHNFNPKRYSVIS